MTEDNKSTSKTSDSVRSEALRTAMHLQEMESNPLDAEQVALFEKFEREGWSDDERLAHLRERAARRAARFDAAE